MRANRILPVIALGLLCAMLNLSSCVSLPGKGGPQILTHNGYVEFTYPGAESIMVAIVGEVLNTGSTNLSFVKIEATFRDQNDKVHSTSSTYTYLQVLLPGEKSPFMFFERTVPEVKSYKLNPVIEFRETDTQPYREFQVVDQASKIDDLLGQYHTHGSVISGCVRRLSAETIIDG